VAFADWMVMPSVSLTFAGSTSIVDLEQAAGETRLAYGGTVTWLGSLPFGVEADFGYHPGFFDRGEASELNVSSRVLTFMGNLVLAAPLAWTGESLRPYVSGGAGAIRADIDDAFDVFQVDHTLFGLNVGGGATGFINDRTGVRWDLRYFKSIKGSDEAGGVAFGDPELSFWRASMALVLRY
jgi:hypothetical protein